MKVVLDWDGTSTVEDSMDALVRALGDADLLTELEPQLRAGELTLQDVIRRELGSVRVPLPEAQRWLAEHVRLRDGFHELVDGHPTVILSSNARQLIEPVLAREGVEVELVANDVDEAWRVTFLDESVCATCGQPCKRGFLPEGEIVYVGDGFSDRCAAQAADRIFATGPLARHLEREGVPFTRFDDLREVAEALAAVG